MKYDSVIVPFVDVPCALTLQPSVSRHRFSTSSRSGFSERPRRSDVFLPFPRAAADDAPETQKEVPET